MISFYKKQGNEYRLTPFHMGPYNYCEYFASKSLAYDDFRVCSDLPSRETCPWPKGTFNISKCLIPMDKIPKYFDGEYRVDLVTLKDDQICGGYQVYFYVIKDEN